MIYHYCSSRDKNCGIAAFSKKLDQYIKDVRQIGPTVPNKGMTEDDTLLLEHEYGLHNTIDMKWVSGFPGKKAVLMHAVSLSPAYEAINKQVMEAADVIIFLTKSCKMQAASKYPEHMGKMQVIPHYCEELIGNPESKLIDGKFVLGIHGFAFPRNGFTRLLNWYIHNDKSKEFNLYIMSSLSTFNKVAEMETGVYIDKMNSLINDSNVADKVELDFAYYETKEEIIQKMRDKCSAALHMTSPARDYYNASGSITTLLAAGRPVIAMNSVFTECITRGAYIPIQSLDDLISLDMSKMEWDPSRVIQYHAGNSIENFSSRLSDIF